MKNFGFGCMRLPMKDGEVDIEQFKEMTDRFIAEGFTYFDTAHGYIDGKSERALREALTSRYPRTAYLLADKLSNNFFGKREDIRPFFENQLKICGVEYFDYYLMHAQNAEYYDKYVSCGAYSIAQELKEEGKIKRVGISFHDKPEVLDKILTEQPQVEFVQIQFNYIDFDDAGIQSRRCWEICRKHGKDIIIMEPVKGGSLVNIPQEAKAEFDRLGGGSPASYAIRFAASFEGVIMVLSGMSDRAQMEDNLSYMKEFKPLEKAEYDAIDRVCAILRNRDIIPCTACRYCTEVCPQSISIPDLFACMNARKLFNDANADWYYGVHTQNAGKASDCIKCGSCEAACPQHLEIRTLLEGVAKEFEKA